jgi:hypothetical protein
MTKQEAIKEACAIVALAYHSVGEYTHSSDGFCGCSPFENYQNDGIALNYVREAVLQRLAKDGCKVADGFDPITGREIV